MTRQKANLEILNKLGQYLTKYPDIRFSQALVNLDLVVSTRGEAYDNVWKDEYHIEPQKILERMPSEQ